MSKTAVADAIRREIAADHFAPGQRLVEAELCDTFGASRSVVRAALMDLVHEELVEHVANRGARVRIVTLEEALQITEVRLAVESLCVARAAERVTDLHIASFRDFGKALKGFAQRGDITGFAELTHQIFETYVRIADNEVAAETLARLRARNARHRFRLTYRPGRAQVALPFWLELIRAICDRDPQAARCALQRLTENVQEGMRAIEHENPAFAAEARFH
jgi:DNA-binding GntR family transcriptional regulator